MEFRTVFIVLFYTTIAFCRNVPDIPRESQDNILSQESNGAFGGERNYGVIDEGSSDSCVNHDKDCKVKGLEERLPPQMPKITSFENPAEPGTWLQSPYQVNHYANVGSLGVGVGNYNGVLYPYAHPNLFAALNPTIPVSRLPSVVPSVTRIRETMPYFGPYLHELPRTRFTREDEEDDFLKQLTHDAIMVNVLPTMPVPMVRSSYASQVPVFAPPAVALYPHNAAGSCGIPLLFSCSPRISKGVLAAHKKPTVIGKYRADHIKAKKEDKEAKSNDTKTSGLPEKTTINRNNDINNNNIN